MTLNELTGNTGEWLRGVGPLADVVISSRARLARNLAEHRFLATADEAERKDIYDSLTHTIAGSSIGSDALIVDLAEASSGDRQALVERHLISRQHALAEGPRGVSISSSETQALMINEEDHLRIQVLRSGLQLDSLWEEVNHLDDTLSASLAFAFDSEFGFLTACPTNVGTGMRVSVMVHLPALKLTKEIDRVDRAVRDLRLAVRGMQGEGTEAIGDLYQVSNQITLGQTEAEIINVFGNKIIPKIVEYERAARDSLAKNLAHQLDDRIWRAYGTLTNARCISSTETQSLLSPIRMAIHMGRFDRFGLDTLNDIFLRTQPAHIQKVCGGPLEGRERGIARADYIRRAINN